MEKESYFLATGAENQDGQVKLSPPMVMTEKPEVPVTTAAPFLAPLEEAGLLEMNREKDSIQDQDTTNPENPQHQEAQENFQQRFRGYRYKDASGPRHLLQQLRELSRRWLDPEVLTKEQIIEMLVQEQFQTSRLRKSNP